MKEKKLMILLLWACVLPASVPSSAFGEDPFEPVKVIYMAGGETMYCQMGSIEGTQVVCRKANGSIWVPLEKVNLEKTFPKYKKGKGETVLLVHSGQWYRDESTIVSNLRMIREEANTPSGPGQVALLCDVINRSDPCRIRVSILARDRQGSSRFEIDLDSEPPVDKEGKAVLKRRLEVSEAKLAGLITSLRVGDVERRNLDLKKEEDSSFPAGTGPEKLREQKINNLKKALLER